ncbi:MAG: PilZ domain-containing protein, partial [Nitrospiria bacterium]
MIFEELTRQETPETKERREISRHTGHKSIAYIAPNGNGSPSETGTFQCSIVDISNGGFRIEVDKKNLLNETIIQAWIPLSNPSVMIPVLSLVRWTNQKKEGIS